MVNLQHLNITMKWYFPPSILGRKKKLKNSTTFLIKIKSNGRGGKILTEKKSGDEMNLIGFFGDFILQENTNPKIFIATGTGLAPIFKMMNAIPDIPKNYIFRFDRRMKFFI